MDTWQTAFKGMYWALKVLAGAAASKAAGTPGLFALAIGKASLDSVPAVAGGMMAGAMPGLVMGFHSSHALVLFNALRAESKYGDKRDQLREIQEAMKNFIKAIDEAVSSSSPIPSNLPETDGSVFLDKNRYFEYTKEVQTAVDNTKAFIENLDYVLNDIERCLNNWNEFLKSLRQFMQADKPRNVFEQLEYYSVNRERDWAWYTDETGFSAACNKLLDHRNKWAKLIDLPMRGALPKLNFASQ